MSKKPPGRTHQRDVESVTTAVTRISADSNTMMSHRLLQVDQELQIISSSHNLRIIQLLQSNATTEEEKSFLLHEGDLLRKRLAANKAQREQSSQPPKPPQASKPRLWLQLFLVSNLLLVIYMLTTMTVTKLRILVSHFYHLIPSNLS